MSALGLTPLGGPSEARSQCSVQGTWLGRLRPLSSGPQPRLLCGLDGGTTTAPFAGSLCSGSSGEASLQPHGAARLCSVVLLLGRPPRPRWPSTPKPPPALSPAGPRPRTPTQTPARTFVTWGRFLGLWVGRNLRGATVPQRTGRGAGPRSWAQPASPAPTMDLPQLRAAAPVITLGPQTRPPRSRDSIMSSATDTTCCGAWE